MPRSLILAASVVFIALLAPTQFASARTPAPEGVSIYIISPVDGEEVTNPVTVRFGLAGMGVAPAGVQMEKTGHHHLLIDLEGAPNLDEPIPSDEHHKHFGGGQTQTTLELAPGKHTLQLLLGDHLHVPHDPPVVSDEVSIVVK